MEAFTWPVSLLLLPLAAVALRWILSAPPPSLAGRVAVVTGGGQGLGRQLVMKLAEQGCRVAVADIVANAAVAAAAGHGAKAYELDVSDPAAVEALAAAVAADFGRPADIVVNNAGIVAGRPVLDASVEQLNFKSIVDGLGGVLFQYPFRVPA